jgi:hypothetical protein
MQYLGDYAEDYATLNFKFSTHKADGTPITLAGTPALSVYKANSTTQSTAGVTLSVDFDSVTGLHNVLIDLSANAFYAVANDYMVVITTGTVDGTSVVGTVVAHFSIQNRPTNVALWKGALAPDIASETDIAAAVRDVDNATPAAGSMGSNIVNIAVLISALVSYSAPLAVTTGAVVSDAGNSATTLKTNLSAATDNHWKDALVLMTSGALCGQVKLVSSYAGTTKIVTVSGGFTGTPAAGDTFVLINR